MLIQMASAQRPRDEAAPETSVRPNNGSVETTIPAKVARNHGIEPGDSVSWEDVEGEGHVRMYPEGDG